MHRELVLSAILALALSACGGGDSGTDCGVNTEKQFVLDVTYDWYLFLDLLPASVNPNAFSTADDLLDFLTAQARAQNKDRFFSFLTSAEGEETFFDEGQAIAFGLGTQLREGHLFIATVEPDSPAAAAGFVRGDEILAIGTNAQNLTPVSTLNTQPGGLNAAFGPSQVGVTRVFSVETPAGETETRTVTKALITLDPVPITAILPRTGLTPIGYLAFETFINPADPQLRQAFSTFKAQGVRDLIVDLRYNGGGLVDIAELLSNLLASDLAGEVMLKSFLNANHPEENATTFFSLEPEAISALRIAFITTSASASASELVINSLEPYAQVALIGGRTFGKPVGQYGFLLEGCDTVLRLVAFRDVNRDDEGDYFDGLPTDDFDGPLCAAGDDLTAERGSLDEDSTASALSWLNNDVCPVAKAAAPALAYPMPRRPTAAQEHRPGLF
jgi:C-terminal processing protease CtpA/Prc